MTNTLYDGSHEEKSCTKRRFGLEPLFMWHGRDVYLPFGAEEGDEGEGGSDGAQDDNTDDTNGEGGSDGGSQGVTREEFDALRKQLSASDKRRDDAEKKLKAQEDAKKDELTKATERAEELEKTVAAKDKELADMRLQNAFLTANTGVTWHDPDDALNAAQRGGYLAEVVGEDGKVDVAKLTTKMKELAKAKPHMVKASEGKDTGTTGKQQATGQKVGSKGGSNGTQGESKLSPRYDRFLNR